MEHYILQQKPNPPAKVFFPLGLLASFALDQRFSLISVCVVGVPMA